MVLYEGVIVLWLLCAVMLRQRCSRVDVCCGSSGDNGGRKYVALLMENSALLALRKLCMARFYALCNDIM